MCQPWTFLLGEKIAWKLVHNAVVLEEVAKMAMYAKLINPELKQHHKPLWITLLLESMLIDAYYGQTIVVITIIKLPFLGKFFYGI